MAGHVYVECYQTDSRSRLKFPTCLAHVSHPVPDTPTPETVDTIPTFAVILARHLLQGTLIYVCKQETVPLLHVVKLVYQDHPKDQQNVVLMHRCFYMLFQYHDRYTPVDL